MCVCRVFVRAVRHAAISHSLLLSALQPSATSSVCVCVFGVEFKLN